MIRVLIFTFLAYLALVIASLSDCLGGEEEPRKFTRGSWAAIILLIPIIGAVCWFVFGKHRPEPGTGGSARPNNGSHGPIAPDDNPDFLRDLDKRLRDNDRNKNDE
ncbi:PLDc N-terminal domain-containing protein [Haloglycomyces albus]|uniref:PLDc N-terminal domain-containing protein n=1 Tax=Haloglycomyces albus TaxID=526067 RepID=UPI0004B85E6A|nr:PLDc N-terminal domain-containing protein [Haloglycomyces albus]